MMLRTNLTNNTFIPEYGLLSNESEINEATTVLKAMAHTIRLKILCTLKESELSVSDIVTVVGSSQSNVSQHLDILKNKGILQSRREGNQVFYRIHNLSVLKLISTMKGVFCS